MQPSDIPGANADRPVAPKKSSAFIGLVKFHYRHKAFLAALVLSAFAVKGTYDEIYSQYRPYMSRYMNARAYAQRVDITAQGCRTLEAAVRNPAILPPADVLYYRDKNIGRVVKVTGPEETMDRAFDQRPDVLLLDKENEGLVLEARPITSDEYAKLSATKDCMGNRNPVPGYFPRIRYCMPIAAAAGLMTFGLLSSLRRRFKSFFAPQGMTGADLRSFAHTLKQ